MDSSQVRVVTRIRPLSSNDKSQGCTSVLQSDPAPSTPNSVASVLRITSDSSKVYEFDAIFPPTSTADEIYRNVAEPLIGGKIFKGFNATILAYGQTGAGKTHTMGTNFETSRADPSGKSDGIIPRSVREIFKIAKEFPGTVDVRLSYLEIYNEDLRDLLLPPSSSSNQQSNQSSNSSNDANEPPPLAIRESLDGSVGVPNLTMLSVASSEDVAKALSSASSRRSTAATQMNATSSRSHAVCTLYITATPEDPEKSGEQLSSKFTLVDLAGSERAKRTGAEGARLKEGININKGLFVLGQVVSALADRGLASSASSKSSSSAPSSDAASTLPSQQSHIPYRDSKLTRLLTDSLGGNSCTVMVACVSPADVDLDESDNTLKYAQRARAIKNSAVKNVISTQILSASEAAALRRENQMLKLQLLQAQMAATTMVSAGNNSNSAFSSADQQAVAAFEGNGSVVNLDRLAIVMKLRSENGSLRARVAAADKRVTSAAEESLTASLQADRWRWKYEQVVEAARQAGVVLDAAHGGDNVDVLTALRDDAERLKSQLQDARLEAEVARATATALVMGDGNVSVAAELALAKEEEEEEEKKQEERATGNDDDDNSNDAKMAWELNEISGAIQQKETMAKQLTKEREDLDVLKSHFVQAMSRLQEEVEALSVEKNELVSKLEGKASTAPDAESKKMKTRLNELQEQIRLLNQKSSEHAKSIKMREVAEKKCDALMQEIEADKKRRAALQRKMKEEMDARRNEKKAAEMKAAKMLREGEKLRVELNKVKEAAAKQANVYKRKALEALQKQKMLAEQRKRPAGVVASANGGANNNGNNNANSSAAASSSGIDKARKEEIIGWLDREIETMCMVRGTKQQLNTQAKLRAVATKKREDLVGTKDGKNLVKALDMEIETRTGVIVQLQRSLMELERECKANSLCVKGGENGGDRFLNFNKFEMKYLLHQIFENLVGTKSDLEVLQTKREAVDAAAIGEAVELEKAKGREVIRAMKIEHSEAIMSLLEATKGAVEHKLTVSVLEAAGERGGGIDEDLKRSVDEMMGKFLGGYDRMGDELFNELSDIKEEERKEKERAEKKKEREKEKKKLDKMKWVPEEVEEAEDVEEEFVDDGELENEDSDWEEETKRKGKKGGKKRTKPAAATAVDVDPATATDSKKKQPAAKKRGGGQKVEFFKGNKIVAGDDLDGSSSRDGSFDDAASMSIDGDDDNANDKESDESEEEGSREETALNVDTLIELTVPQLKDELRKRSLVVSGKKADLIQRLASFLKANDEKDEDMEEEEESEGERDESITSEGENNDSMTDGEVKSDPFLVSRNVDAPVIPNPVAVSTSTLLPPPAAALKPDVSAPPTQRPALSSAPPARSLSAANALAAATAAVAKANGVAPPPMPPLPPNAATTSVVQQQQSALNARPWATGAKAPAPSSSASVANPFGFARASSSAPAPRPPSSGVVGVSSSSYSFPNSRPAAPSSSSSSGLSSLQTERERQLQLWREANRSAIANPSSAASAENKRARELQGVGSGDQGGGAGAAGEDERKKARVQGGIAASSSTSGAVTGVFADRTNAPTSRAAGPNKVVGVSGGALRNGEAAIKKVIGGRGAA